MKFCIKHNYKYFGYHRYESPVKNADGVVVWLKCEKCGKQKPIFYGTWSEKK